MFSDFQDDVLGFSFEIGGFWWNTSKHHRFNLYLLLELVSYRLYYLYYGIWTSLRFFVETLIGSVMITLYGIIL